MALPGFTQGTMVDSSIGNEKFKTDKRQFAGLLMAFSLCATFFPLAGLAGLINRDDMTAKEGIALSSLIAGLCVVLIGITGMTTAYLTLVHDWGNRLLTAFLLVWVQTAWIPYITDMTNVGKLAATGAAFIPEIYSPSVADVRFVGAMGILGIFSFGFCFLGSLAFVSFALYAYQVGKPGDRSASYYQSRLRVYSIQVMIAGLAQLMLGSYILAEFGSGPLPAPIGVAMFTVFFPEISVFVGLVYILNGIHGALRGFGVIKAGPENHYYQMGMWLQYFFTLVLMIIVQTTYADGGMFAGAVPSRAALTFGASVLPAFLDYKARTTPYVLPENYYGLLDHEKEILTVMHGGDDMGSEGDSTKEGLEMDPCGPSGCEA